MNDTIRNKLTPRARVAVTLIELLVVVGLMGFMAGLAMYALRGAQDDARVARTRGTITKLNDIILQQWEEYRYRAVDVRLDSSSGISPRLQSHFRMLVLRDTMRMEMPDRVSDLIFDPTRYQSPDGAIEIQKRGYPHKFGLLYRSLYTAISNSKHTNLMFSPAVPKLENPLDVGDKGYTDALDSNGQPRQLFSDSSIDQWNSAVQSSELLYLIVANSTFGGTSALEDFRPSEIGDPDDDGLLEFIDAWGNPIHWIRWPAGYPSDLNRYSGTDAMDPLRTDWRYLNSAEAVGFNDSNRPRTIVPLIVSAGADGKFGITVGFTDSSGQEVPVVYARMRQGFTNQRYYIDPFFTWDYQNNVPNGSNSEPPFDENHPKGYRANQLGSIPKFVDDGVTRNEFAADNITNHDIILGL